MYTQRARCASRGSEAFRRAATFRLRGPGDGEGGARGQRFCGVGTGSECMGSSWKCVFLRARCALWDPLLASPPRPGVCLALAALPGRYVRVAADGRLVAERPPAVQPVYTIL